MPYVITTKRPDLVSAQVRHMRGGLVTSRRAVATLEGREIWNALYGVEIPNREEVVEQIAALPESGGSVGPLPDGTMIEVEQVEWMDLARPLGAHWWHVARNAAHGMVEAQQSLLDAFNAREARS